MESAATHPNFDPSRALKGVLNSELYKRLRSEVGLGRVFRGELMADMRSFFFNGVRVFTNALAKASNFKKMDRCIVSKCYLHLWKY